MPAEHTHVASFVSQPGNHPAAQPAATTGDDNQAIRFHRAILHCHIDPPPRVMTIDTAQDGDVTGGCKRLAGREGGTIADTPPRSRPSNARVADRGVRRGTRRMAERP